MSIPKTIYQTFKTNKLPLLTKWHIMRLKQKNPDYTHEFYDDERIDSFIKDEFEPEVYKLYSRINIGAAKADFFRYAILYKKGGIYLDIDGLFLNKLNEIVLPTDDAIICIESQKINFVQWALFFEAGHPFLKKTMELMCNNLRENKYPNDVHSMTGPTVYTKAIKKCLEELNNISYRETGIDYDKKLEFSYRMSKTFLYGFSRKNHWLRLQNKIPVLKTE